MPEWADVYVKDVDERANLNGKALFFIPSARPTLVDAEITPAALASYARNAADVGGSGTKIGLQAITKVINCGPATYDSVRKFILAANSMLKNRGRTEQFTKTHIVACVFRFRDFKAALDACKVNSDQVADACKIKREIVGSLKNSNYRVSLAHALAIRDHFCSLVKENGSVLSDLDTIAGCITAYSRAGDTVALLKEPKNDSKDKDNYYYTRNDLTAAPPSGHPWAISP